MQNCQICQMDRNNRQIETELSFANVFNNPIKFGHIIVAPKRHIENFIFLTEDEIKDLYLLSHRIAKILNQKISEDKLYQLHIGDKDSHFHLHLIPRMAEDKRLGPYIFGPDGWRGEAQEHVDENKSFELLKQIKEVI